MPYNNIVENSLETAEQFQGKGDFSVSAAQNWNNTFLYSWLFPGAEQEREFGQQMAAQQYQNEWNSEVSRMARMKAAGINVDTAAAGIAGAGSSPSVGAPNSAVGAGSNSAGSLAAGVGALGGLAGTAVDAYKKLKLTPIEADKGKAEIKELLSTVLHNEWLVEAIVEMLPLQKDNERADTFLKLANFDKAREEKLLINKRISEVEAHINELNKQAALYEKQGNVAMAEELKIQAETILTKLQSDKLSWEKDWRDRYKYDPNVPVDVALEQSMVNGSGDEVVGAVGKSIQDVNYKQRKGFNAAEVEDAYNKSWSDYKAKMDVDAEFAPYLAAIESQKEEIISLTKEMIESPDDIQGMFIKLWNLFGNLFNAYSSDRSVVGRGAKPPKGRSAKW